MSGRAPKFSIILAGGKGTRMRSADRHKVCFLIDGRPAINRALDVYKACGIPQHIIVVGAMAGQVIETVGQDGGFIMSSSTVLDEADPDLVRVWVEATKEFGQY